MFVLSNLGREFTKFHKSIRDFSISGRTRASEQSDVHNSPAIFEVY